MTISIYLQPDLINMAVLFWYLVKIGTSVRYLYSSIHLTGHVFEVPETHGHV